MAFMDIYNYKVYNKVPEEQISYSEELPNNSRPLYVSIDDSIVYVIQILNIKGYYTKFCCSGHYGDEEPGTMSEVGGGYIYFKEPHRFECLPKCITQESAYIIRFDFKTKSNTGERFYELNDIICELSNWAENLHQL